VGSCHPQANSRSVGNSEDIFDVEPKVGHRSDHHADKVGTTARSLAVGEQLHKVMAHDGRVQKLLSSCSESSIVDRLDCSACCFLNFRLHVSKPPIDSTKQCGPAEVEASRGNTATGFEMALLPPTR
jgi:hypothetical protein